MENRLALKMCTITGIGVATNLAFSKVIGGLPAKPAMRAIPAANGIALSNSSASGILQSIRVSFVIEGVYE
jgi:hypothetical protein